MIVILKTVTVSPITEKSNRASNRSERENLCQLLLTMISDLA